jgi:hypothetical protein
MSKQFEHMQKLAFGKIITEGLTSQNLTESELRNKIKELVQSTLGEAKKKKKKETDVAPQEDVVDMDMGLDMEAPTEDTLAPTSTDEIDIDPKVKTIQDSLSKALANAKALGDEKLVNQIGNTITMLVRTQVVGQQVAENINEYADGAQFYVNLLKDYLDDEEDLNNLIKAVEIIKTNFQSLEEMQGGEHTDLLSILQDYVSADYTADQGYGDGVVEKAEADKERIEAEVTRMKGAEYFKALKKFANLVTYDDEYAGAEESAEIQPLLAELAEKLGFTVDQLRGI